MEMKTVKKPFFERNDSFLNHDINYYFDDLVAMTPDEFRDWVIEMRKTVVKIWDEEGNPPRTGKNENDIIDEWNKMEGYPTEKTFTFTDELSDIDNDVLINRVRLGAEVDQWFSTMMKTRINYSDKDNGHSIYDLFSDDKFLERMYKGSMRHFRRDSMYNHAKSAIKKDPKFSVVSVETGEEWMEAFYGSPTIFKGKGFILEEVKMREGVNSGYHQLNQSDILHLTKQQVLDYKEKGWLKYKNYSTFDVENMPDNTVYNIRVYKTGEKIFPKGFASFRIGYIQVAHNYPPATAKCIYERFTEHCKDEEVLNIYDPSAGWGGRILGAMSCRDDRVVHYIGTDPNPDNFYTVDSVVRSKYEDVAEFYNTRTYRGNSFLSEPNTYHIFQECAEDIGNHPDFQRYRGCLDFVFTSPPYFNREAYSEDENQSYKKYGSSYESWRDGFLRPTLETCVEFLKSDRYLLWNIADLLVKGKYIPLEKDSKDILESLGMEYKYVLKMAMEGMPGQNRLDENGVPKCKNFCKVKDTYYKYEPVFVYYKP